jgi:hypothetical protein
MSDFFPSEIGQLAAILRSMTRGPPWQVPAVK